MITREVVEVYARQMCRARHPGGYDVEVWLRPMELAADCWWKEPDGIRHHEVVVLETNPCLHEVEVKRYH